MTNETIILNHAFKLMESGKIAGSGEYSLIVNENGEETRKELPEEIHTFKYWKDLGRSVKKGEKAVASFAIWKYTAKMLDTETGDAETDKLNASINEQGGQSDIFMKVSSFFTFGQTEPTEEREKRRAERKENKEIKNAVVSASSSLSASVPATVEPEETGEDTTAEEPEEVQPHYYDINEATARRAKEMCSYDDYKEGSATAEYRASVDSAAAELEEVKRKCKTAEQRERAEFLFDRYCKALAEYINRDNEIGTRCPSILVAGGSNFPVKKKAKQVAAWEKNQGTYEKAESYLCKMRGVCYQSVKSDDPEAIEVLRAKLEKLEANHEAMKKHNAEARKNGGEQLPWYALPYNLDAIKRTRARLEQLETTKSAKTVTKEYDGYTYEENTEDMRIRFLFDGKPDEKTRNALKENGFRWAPSASAWQRQLTTNGKLAAERVKTVLRRCDE